MKFFIGFSQKPYLEFGLKPAGFNK